jgi:hypothetical protein
MHDIRPYLPELFNAPGYLLYIGARPDAHSWLDELAQAGHTISVLEIWPDNAAGLMDDPRVAEVMIGDVRQLKAVHMEGAFDYVLWWHGPEHVNREEAAGVLNELERLAARTVAVACPWGIYPQGAHDGNPHETHRWSVYPADLAALGYETATDGQADTPGSEVVGWKRR